MTEPFPIPGPPPAPDWYTGSRAHWRDASPELPEPLARSLDEPEDYLPGTALVAAVNVALTLGQPLLLTGEPGVGKTCLAANVASELALGTPLKCEVRSTTEAGDLFYTFDAMAQFRDAHAGADAPSARWLDKPGRPGGAAPEAAPPVGVRRYLALQGLGLAILLTRTPDDALVRRYWDPVRNDGPFRGPCRSVVLIDEIDKAPRDVPNDLLNQIELAYFRIREDDNRRIDADPALWPIVIMTSNSEKHLPDAFLRRCVYHHIEFPDAVTLARIVDARLARVTVREHREPLAPALVAEALELFAALRSAPALRRRPGTAELLALLLGLLRRAARPDSLKPELRGASTGAPPALAPWLLGTLVKNAEDLAPARAVLDGWSRA